MASPEDFSGTDAERFSQMLSVPGEHTADGEYTIDDPIVIPADVILNCTGAVFHGDGLTRGGAAPDTFFRIASASGGSVTIVGGEFRNGHFLSIQNNLSFLSIDLEKFVQDDTNAAVALIPQSSVTTRTADAHVRVRYASSCNLIFSTTFGGSELHVQFDRVDNLVAYACRTRPPNSSDQWDRITLADSEFVGNADPSQAAVRVYQSLVKTAGLTHITGVTMQDMTCTGYVSLCYWSSGNCLVENSGATNIYSGADERLIESKSTDDVLLTVRNCLFDQRAVDATLSQNPCIDAKERRFRVYSNTFRGCTGHCLTSSCLAGYVAFPGVRQFDRNVIDTHRSPAIVAIQCAASGQKISQYQIRWNAVTGHDNPSQQLAWSAATTAIVHVNTPQAAAEVVSIHLVGNVYESVFSGKCCFVRLNQYDSSVSPVDFTRGDMIRAVFMVGNSCVLPGGWVLNWRNGTPTGTIMSFENSFAGIVGLFGKDTHTSQTIVPIGYTESARTVTVTETPEIDGVQRSGDAKNVAISKPRIVE